MLTYLLGLAQLLWLRSEPVHDERGGPTTEIVIITAALAAVALTVTAIIVSGVTGRAESIDFGP
ncbi:MAG: hypothetical protein GEV12_21890 [Micromonosporaceae bacterium]|nr:hypothetical protein [Micromonosporaceae bacterium]